MMFSADVHNVSTVEIDKRTTSLADGVPYDVVKLAIVSLDFHGNRVHSEITLFGRNEITITVRG
mgnify:CR=1 FL=1